MQEKKENIMRKSRPWNDSLLSWVSRGSHHNGQKSNNSMDESKTLDSCVFTDEIINKCFICNESFDVFWNDGKDEWHLKNAKKQLDHVYHPSCL